MSTIVWHFSDWLAGIGCLPWSSQSHLNKSSQSHLNKSFTILSIHAGLSASLVLFKNSSAAQWWRISFTAQVHCTSSCELTVCTDGSNLLAEHAHQKLAIAPPSALGMLPPSKRWLVPAALACASTLALPGWRSSWPFGGKTRKTFRTKRVWDVPRHVPALIHQPPCLPVGCRSRLRRSPHPVSNHGWCAGAGRRLDRNGTAPAPACN